MTLPGKINENSHALFRIAKMLFRMMKAEMLGEGQFCDLKANYYELYTTVCKKCHFVMSYACLFAGGRSQF